ncbi:MAG: rhomboid family intramembrane serine protease [Bacteroidia bacterium]|nr:MAG: rhomboid family intramembrane serine protease [Bacteroidia bacterium]
MGFIDEIKNFYTNSNIVIRLIAINVAVFLVVHVFNVIFFLFNIESVGGFTLVGVLSVPADLLSLVFRIWTPVTYMFLHEGFFHILFNMLWLFWLGTLFYQFIGERQLLTVYLLGGLSGAFLFVLSYNIFPAFSNVKDQALALGASASVMAIIIATCVYRPNFAINLLFFGPVKLKYIGIVSVILDLMMIPNSNAGGHIAHLGGAFFGLYYIMQLKKRNDLSGGFQKFLEKFAHFFKKKSASRMKVSYKKDNFAQGSRRPTSDYDYNKQKFDTQKEIDQILDKISKSGYDSLSKQEKELLFKQSDKK